MIYATVTTKGQIVIPEKIRKQLNIKPGVRVLVSIKNGQINMQIDDYINKIDSFRAKIKAKQLPKISNDDINKAKNNLWKLRNQ